MKIILIDRNLARVADLSMILLLYMYLSIGPELETLERAVGNSKKQINIILM